MTSSEDHITMGEARDLAKRYLATLGPVIDRMTAQEFVAFYHPLSELATITASVARREVTMELERRFTDGDT